MIEYISKYAIYFSGKVRYNCYINFFEVNYEKRDFWTS